MGLIYNQYLSSDTKVYGCKECKTHFSTQEDILSRVSCVAQLLSSLHTHTDILLSLQNFRGQHGKAYLFDNVVNIILGDPAERSMTTGKHVVRDINCRQCKAIVGWKYDKAYEPAEKYKEGKFILEAELLLPVS